MDFVYVFCVPVYRRRKCVLMCVSECVCVFVHVCERVYISVSQVDCFLEFFPVCVCVYLYLFTLCAFGAGPPPFREGFL